MGDPLFTTVNSQVTDVLTKAGAVSKDVSGLVDKVTALDKSVDEIQRILVAAKEKQDTISNGIKQLAEQTPQLNKDIADINDDLILLNNSSNELLVMLGKIMVELEWSVSQQQIAGAELSIASKFEMLQMIAKLKANEPPPPPPPPATPAKPSPIEIQARRLARDILDTNRGVIPALLALHAVLVGDVALNPRQEPLLLQFLARVNASKIEDKEAVMNSYVFSLIMLQVKGLLLLVNACKSVGNLEEGSMWTERTFQRFAKQLTLVGRQSQLLLCWTVCRPVRLVVDANSPATPITLTPDGMIRGAKDLLPNSSWQSVVVSNKVTLKIVLNGVEHQFPDCDTSTLTWHGTKGQTLVVPQPTVKLF